MILNMHIRGDFNSWIEDTSKRRVKTLCHKMTEVKYTGIPGINAQRPTVMKDYTGVDVGWCLECCRQFVIEYASLTEDIDNVHLRGLYRDAIDLCIHQLDLATSLE